MFKYWVKCDFFFLLKCLSYSCNANTYVTWYWCITTLIFYYFKTENILILTYLKTLFQTLKKFILNQIKHFRQFQGVIISFNSGVNETNLFQVKHSKNWNKLFISLRILFQISQKYSNGSTKIQLSVIHNMIKWNKDASQK